MNAKDYIKQLLSIENFSFSLEEITQQTDNKGTSLKFELARLIEKKEIVNLRKGFYLIIPPRYSRQGQIPIQLYIEKLFKYLNKSYYLGFYTAAKFHGASHQQSQKEYVMIQTPSLPDINKNSVDIRFFTTTTLTNKNIIEKKSDAGIFKISSPVLTTVDLIHHQTKLGGLNRMLAIIEELSEEINEIDLSELLTWYPHKSTLQRLGFILELVEADEKLIEILSKYFERDNYYPVLLSPRSSEKPGAVNNKWKVAINIKLESDL
ncbi:type IV toxin-antitoxin system AbiEi family antitoxin [Lutibacter sp. A80]|uniref:type IV toxin-antitoxin system AbiEi family antitoxin domain-containing protein n=1 Tax=Lutibacter sp. A80 TaxID=2918453 RepID=UPI001F057A04|nr:type IV toxin-antitoxin system AbiEi family antitoxin [Lutibacter sp. A80]UMB59230.1 type IV toxin-antitoxin system AbiEi family antitoxin [Lutibacter sp. A80]